MLYICKTCFKQIVGSMLKGMYTHKGCCSCCKKENVRLYLEVNKAELPEFGDEEEDFESETVNITFWGTMLTVLFVMIITYLYFLYQNT